MGTLGNGYRGTHQHQQAETLINTELKMITKLKFPKISFAHREHFIHQRCAYLGDHEVQKAVIEGRFVLAWDGELNPEERTPTLGVLESVTMNNDGSRTYTITSENGTEYLDYQNAVVLREEWCPEVVLVDKYGNRYLHKWIGLQERKDGKIYAVVSQESGASIDVEPSQLILLDDCKVGLPEREEV